MNIEKQSYYKFSIKKYFLQSTSSMEYKWDYVIFDSDYKPTLKTIIRESDEWYDTEEEARLAAIDHINLLENGEG